MLEIDQNTGRVCTSFAAGAQAVNLTQVGSVTITAAAALSDATANPTAPLFGSATEAFNGTTWDRVRSGGTNVDTIPTTTLGAIDVLAFTLGWDGATWDRINAILTNGDGFGATSFRGFATASANLVYNPVGNSWDRAREAPGTVGVPSVNIEGTKLSYRAAAVGLVPVAATTDIACFENPGAKVARLNQARVHVSGTAGVLDVLLIKRSTLDTGSTPTTQTAVPMDSNDAVATAQVRTFATTNPTPGATVGNLGAGKIDISAATLTALPLSWEFGNRNAKEAVVRGTTQAICVNGNGVVMGNSVDVEFEWTEE